MSGSQRFFHVVLRTVDEPAAREFYAAVLGVDARGLIAFPLHESALARGARPHWLGFIAVDALDAAVAAFGTRGAVALGPRWVNPHGLEAAVMRDPGGAPVALAVPPPGMPAQPFEVGWYLLNTPDVEQAKATYGALFGWDFRPAESVAGEGQVQPFAWRAGEAEVGVFSDSARRPGIHPHWLFLLRVPSVARAVAEVRARGGQVTGELTLPSGAHVAVCDDPQGAAFGLID